MIVPVRLITAVLLCTACSASQPGPGTVRNGEAPRAGTGYVLGAGGVRLFYRMEGQGPDTIVVLHGGPGFSLEGLRPDLRPLARHHTLLYFDQRGSGRSEMPDTSLARAIDPRLASCCTRAHAPIIVRESAPRVCYVVDRLPERLQQPLGHPRGLLAGTHQRSNLRPPAAPGMGSPPTLDSSGSSL